MPFPVACPECEYRFRVPDNYAGRRGKCPKCQTVFIANPPGREQKSAHSSPTVKSVRVAASKSVRVEDAPTPPPAPPDARSSTEALSKPPVESTVSPAIEPPSIAIAPAVADIRAPSKLAPQLRKRRSNATGPMIVAGMMLVGLLVLGGALAWNTLDGNAMFAEAGLHNTANKDTKRNHTAGNDTANKNAADTPAGKITEDTSDNPAGNSGSDSNNDNNAVDNHPTIEPLRENGPTGGQDNPFDPPLDPIPAPEVGEGDFGPMPKTLDPAMEQKVKQALAQVQVTDGAGKTRSGLGVVVDSRGWVATVFSLLRNAKQVKVTLHDGRTCDVIIAVSPQANLALMKLVGANADVPALEINQAPGGLPGDTLYIAGLDGTTPTKFSSAMPTSSLPEASRALLPPEARSGNDVQWLHHKTPVDGQAEGAPLLDAGGKVIGINAGLGPTKNGYAVLAAYIAAMMQDDRIAALNPKPSPPRGPTKPPQNDPAPPINSKLVKKFQALQRTLADSGWQPEGKEGYSNYQQFASVATEIFQMIDEGKFAAPQAQAIRNIMDPAIDAMAKAQKPKMSNEDEMVRVNRLATAAPAQENPGLYAYGRCVMRPEDFGAKAIDGLPLFAFELIGTDELVILPVAENGNKISIGSQWLILGNKDAKEKFPAFSLPDAPNAKREGTVVRAKILLGKVEQPNSE